MCVKNVNVNCFFCKSVQSENGCYSFIETFDSIEGLFDEENGVNCFLSDCNIVVLTNIIQSETDNPLDKNIRCKLTLVSKKTGRATQIMDFSLDTQTDVVRQNEYQCKDFINKRFVIHLDKLVLNSGQGDYILKLWMKDEDTWKIQSMSQLTVK